jgi:hypothetical protein
MRIPLIILIQCAALCGSVFAHTDRIETPRQLTISFTNDTHVDFTISNAIVTAITVRVGKTTHPIPEKECRKLRDIHFESTKLLWNGSYKTPARSNYFYVQFAIGQESERTFGDLPLVEVHFRDGKFTAIAVTKRTSDTRWETMPL